MSIFPDSWVLYNIESRVVLVDSDCHLCVCLVEEGPGL